MPKNPPPPSCPKCRKPMHFIIVKTGGRKFQCVQCDGVDPMRMPDIRINTEHTERSPEGRMLFRFVRDPGEPSPGPAPGVNKPPSLTGTFLFPVAGQRECAPCQSATGVMWLTAFVGLGNGIRRSSIRAASRRIAPGWSEGFHKGTHAPRLRSRPS